MTNDMTTGNPRGLMIRFAIPLVIGNIFQQFYTVVDSVVVGRFIGVDALAAVGSTGSVIFFIMGLVMGVTNGFSVLVAQSVGAKDEKRTKHFIVMAGYLSIVITIILTIATLLGIDWILRLMKTPDNIFADASLFCKIMFAGLGVTTLYNLLSAILRAFGDSKTPLLFLAIASIINIVLDLLFIVKFHMGVEGAGYATVIAQAVSGILCLVYMVKKYPSLRMTKEDLAFSGRSALYLLSIGIPMSLQFSITAIGVMILQSALNVLGSVYIAGFTAASKVQQIIMQPFISLGATMTTYIGQNTGAGNVERIKQGMREGIKLTLIYSVISAIFLVVLGRFAVRMFVSSEETQVLAVAQQYFYIVAGFFPALGLIFIFRNTLQGLGDGLFPMLGGIFELIARAGVAFTLAKIMGYAGVCLADPAAWVGALIPLIPVYYIRMKKMTAMTALKN